MQIYQRKSCRTERLIGGKSCHIHHTNKNTRSYFVHDRKAEENIKGIQFAWKEVFGFCDQNLEKLDKEFWKHYNEEKKRENKKEN